eukprot:scaffold62179_cov62-Phaeocystis_antarctica.AAC.1
MNAWRCTVSTPVTSYMQTPARSMRRTRLPIMSRSWLRSPLAPPSRPVRRGAPGGASPPRTSAATTDL